MGLDLTIGKSPQNVGGLLLRSMVDVEDGSTIEGPCNLVKEILSKTNQPNIKSLVESDGFKLSAFGEQDKSAAAAGGAGDGGAGGDGGGVLRLVRSTKSRQDTITQSPRYGLFLKKDPGVKEPWVMSPYRFISDSCRVKKQKNLVSLSVWLAEKNNNKNNNNKNNNKKNNNKNKNKKNKKDDGFDDDYKSSRIKKVTGVTVNQFKKHRKAFQEGTEMSELSSFHNRPLKANCLVKLYGAWVKKYGSRYGLCS